MRYRRLLVPYIECGLDERVRAKVEAHLSRCPRCSEELELIRSVSGEIRSAQAPPMEPAPDLWAKVSARIEQDAPRTTPRLWLRATQAASACAAAVLVAAVGIGLMRVSMPSERPGVPPVAYQPSTQPPASKAKRVTSERADLRGPRAARETTFSRPLPTAAEVASSAGVRTRPRSARPPAAPLPRVAELPSAAAGRSTVPTEVSTVTVPAADVAVKADDYVVAASPAPTSAFATPRYKHPNGSRLADSTPEKKDEDAVAGVKVALSDYAADISKGVRTDALGIKVHFHETDARPASAATARSAGGIEEESVVDALNETEGVRTAALFRYP